MPIAVPSAAMQVIGQYDLVEKIAEGGMGTVYRGRHRATGEIVAVKVVPQHLLANAVVLKRFEQEYNVARLIDHPNIVKALDCGRDGETRFLVMEFVDGESLGQKIERDGKMSEEEAIKIIAQVAEGLSSAHKQGVIHRDVKPDNILVTSDGVAKLTDLGLVKELEADQNLTRTGRGLGTPHFMAPEQFRNAKKADVRCDIYSLGATLYMMVTGELPFQSNGPLDAWMKKINNEIQPPRKFAPELSERIDWAIRRAMSPDPVHRPECCREFIEDLTGQSTRNLTGTEAGLEALPDCWYVVYKDTADEVHTVKGTTKGIRRSLKEGVLGSADVVRVARTKAGPFESLRQHVEFRDLVIQPEKAPTLKSKASELKLKQLLQSPGTAVPGLSTPAAESGVLTSTVIMAAVDVARAPERGPCIPLKASGAGVGAGELWKWLTLAAVFVSGGVLAAILLPLLRHFRIF